MNRQLVIGHVRVAQGAVMQAIGRVAGMISWQDDGRRMVAEGRIRRELGEKDPRPDTGGAEHG